MPRQSSEAHNLTLSEKPSQSVEAITSAVKMPMGDILHVAWMGEDWGEPCAKLGNIQNCSRRDRILELIERYPDNPRLLRHNSERLPACGDIPAALLNEISAARKCIRPQWPTNFNIGEARPRIGGALSSPTC